MEIALTSARTITRNIASNQTGFLVHGLIAFFLTPFVLGQLGDVRYGVWSLMTAITGYYGLIDLGLRSGLTQYITRYFAAREFDNMNRSASTGFVVLASCALVTLPTSVALALGAPYLFNLPSGIENEVAWCIVIVASGVAMQFCFFPFSAAFVATQRYDLANAIGIFSRILTASVVFIALSQGYGLIALSGITTGGNMVDYLLRWRVATRILPELRLSPRLFDRSRCGEIIGYGIWAFLAQCSTRIARSSGAIIIGILMSAAAVGRYGLAVTVVTFFENSLGPAARVFFPVTTHMDATGDLAGLRRLYTTGTRLMLLVVVLLGFVGSVFAADFFRLWIGDARMDDQFGNLPKIFRLLLVSAGLSASQYLGNQILLGRREVRSLAALSGGYAAMYLVLATFLVHSSGLIGIALAAAVTAFVFQALLVPYVCCRSVQLSLRQYAGDAYVRPATLICVLLPFAWLKHVCVPLQPTWLTLASCGAMTFLAASLAGSAIVLTRLERRMVFGKLSTFVLNDRHERSLQSETGRS